MKSANPHRACLATDRRIRVARCMAAVNRRQAESKRVVLDRLRREASAEVARRIREGIDPLAF